MKDIVECILFLVPFLCICILALGLMPCAASVACARSKFSVINYHYRRELKERSTQCFVSLRDILTRDECHDTG